MNLAQAKAQWSAHKKRRRVGRGEGSGWGKTSGRGHKGLKARSGGTVDGNFNGGSTPLFRRIPKIGFTNNRFKAVYRTINVSALEVLDNGTEVTADLLLEKGLIRKGTAPVKILGNGELTKNLKVVAAKVTAGAAQKIESAGGSVELKG